MNSSTSLISDPGPLQPETIPLEFECRQQALEQLKNRADSGRNIHLYGERGTGKTHLTLSTLQSMDDVQTCYVDCRHCQTQYQILQQILRKLTGEPVKDGLHTSTLQRRIEDRTTAVQTIIVLDEIDFLLQEDEDSTLYHLSRTSNPIHLVTISPNKTELQDHLEERTYSSLQPQTIQLQPYTEDQTYQILLQRAQKALKPQTLQKQALGKITSQADDLKSGLHWLKAAAETAENAVTVSTVEQTREKAFKQHAQQLLQPFTQHHHLTHQAIKELHSELGTVTAGDVYQKYRELTDKHEIDSLTDRRISDYLKHLELLDLIEAEYHYGGRKGKTREITVKRSVSNP
ncbi:Cdc6/Cdc18 family protein [Halobellus rubicundus]|uniref:Cdc6/Cdc18 family protein n=1 Tax=Halobellus rubicundus TaxID=2996466 RepID=A0ABD5M807_9EURY